MTIGNRFANMDAPLAVLADRPSGREGEPHDQ